MLRTARSRDKAFEGRRILVVDDDMRNIFALTSALEHKGAAVDVARNGIEALAKLRERPNDIDLVLMDIMMPEMDGFTATREIRKNPRWAKLPPNPVRLVEVAHAVAEAGAEAVTLVNTLLVTRRWLSPRWISARESDLCTRLTRTLPARCSR